MPSLIYKSSIMDSSILLLSTDVLIKHFKEYPEQLNKIIISLRKDKIEQLKANKK